MVFAALALRRAGGYWAAARRGSTDLVDLLLRHKASVNRADYTGRTALGFARQANKQAVAGMIQRAGGKE